jgi:adenylate cyclase class 2
MESLEIEVKYFLENIEPVREQLIKTGAESHGRFFENNICFDNAKDGLSLSDSVLRLRKDEKTTLTYKTKPNADDSEFKVVKELEVEVSDFETMLNILCALGFHQSQIYEKYRETFTIGDAKLCLDRMPFGDFLEIEGGKDEIRNLSQQIGMQWNRRILGNYRFLFGIIKERLSLSFSDITFDNFREVKMDMKTFLPLFEAGGINTISEIRH